MSKITKALEPKWLIVVVFFISGIFLGGLGLYIWFGTTSGQGFNKLHPARADYKYINPLLGIEVQNSSSFSGNASLELKMHGFFDNAKKSGKIEDGSIYFRDLESGYWSGVNEDKNFSLGKILKVPLMIAYYKLAEEDPNILKTTIVNNIAQPTETDNLFPSPEPLVYDKSYTVEELMRDMSVHSDDIATELLFDNIDKNALEKVYSDLGIGFKEDKETTDSISLKLYSLFFRVLINSTYLSREYSEKALSLLDQLNDKIGVGEEIPKDLIFVHRYGGRKYVENNINKYQMYDCGIIYYPDHPYILCASVKGQSMNALEEYLKNLGKEVYSEIDFKYKK